MDLHVEHTTEYRYSLPSRHSIQYIRLTPPSNEGQTVRYWQIDAPERLTQWYDGFGNIVHTLVMNSEHEALRLTVHGTVSTSDTSGVLPSAERPDASLFLLQPTALTRADEDMARFVESLGRPDSSGLIGYLHVLMAAIRDRVDYLRGETDVAMTAAEAFLAGAGFYQDHAHIFAACARLAGLPTRYVSGYLCDTLDGHARDSSHAWAETLVPHLGWVGFDPANGISPDDRYIRIACGRDYRDAAPVRGIRSGGGGEVLAMRVAVLDAADSDATAQVQS
ncbi:transglutaminase family protein [Iodidimonas sp. SYSU 1G8]|uniref:transglutaminase family protein n=1 Tax=Iodidimonas sp. SYSU 1G8 TaxID=3133967 RepID=UPI0031FE5F6F